MINTRLDRVSGWQATAKQAGWLPTAALFSSSETLVLLPSWSIWNPEALLALSFERGADPFKKGSS